jgi:AraC-like DNA-binding protein
LSATRSLQVLEGARRSGLDPVRICSRAGTTIEALREPGQRTTVAQYYEIWRAAMQLSDRPELPLSIARAFAPDPLDVLWFACATAGDLSAAFHQFNRYRRMCTGGCDWEIHEGANEVRLTFVSEAGEGCGARAASEFALAELLHCARLLSGVHWQPLHVALPHPAPRDTKAHREFFGLEPRWGSARTELSAEPSILRLTLVKSDPQLSTLLSHNAEALLASHSDLDDIGSEVRRAVGESLEAGEPTLATVAKRLALSERTLKRRLHEQGLTFAGLLSDVRKQRATLYLDDPKLTVSEVGFLVGYSEPSAFHRAFRRWTGKTPQAYRSDYSNLSD